MPAPSYDARSHYRGAVADAYATRRRRDPQWHREHASMAGMLARRATTQAVLDVPFGTGRFADLYLRRDDSVAGVDISMDMLSAARSLEDVRKLAPRLIQADAESIPLADSSVDLAVCTRFFNWLPVELRVRVLRELARVARQGILLQIRVRDEPPQSEFWLRLVREVARHPVASVSGRTRGLMRRAKRLIASAAGSLALPDPTATSEPLPSGYSVPDERALKALFRAANVVEEEMVAVHADYDLRRGIIYEMRVHYLRVAPEIKTIPRAGRP